MAVLCAGGTIAAIATAMMATHPSAGIALAVVGFLFIGFGVGASGTTLLVLLATRTDERRRPAAATIVWVMMIAGFIVTAATAGSLLDPFSPARLVEVASVISLAAFVLSLIAVWGIEGDAASARTSASNARKPSFRAALAEVLAEPQARRFGIFIFVSMLAFSAQDLILEPFAGIVFGYTPGESTRLSGMQNSGVLAGMVLVAIAGSAIGGRRLGSLPMWTVAGCVCSALALFGLVCAAAFGPAWPLRFSVFLLGFFNGVYAVAAIGSMMALVAKGAPAREGVRMGLWGAAQAFAFGLGGFLGAAASDLARHWLGSPAAAYGIVFAIEGILFLVAAVLALRIAGKATVQPPGVETLSGRNAHASA
jgi:BCD family chlorophyll transporter-like MFS transporter